MREIHGRRQKVILTLQTLRRLGVLLSGPSIYDKKSPVSLLQKIKIRMQSKNDFYNDIIFLIRTVTRVTTLSSEKCVQIPHNFTTILWPNISPCWDFQLLGVKLAWLITRCLYCAARREFSIQLHHRRGQGTQAHRHTGTRHTGQVLVLQRRDLDVPACWLDLELILVTRRSVCHYRDNQPEQRSDELCFDMNFSVSVSPVCLVTTCWLGVSQCFVPVKLGNQFHAILEFLWQAVTKWASKFSYHPGWL